MAISTGFDRHQPTAYVITHELQAVVQIYKHFRKVITSHKMSRAWRI